MKSKEAVLLPRVVNSLCDEVKDFYIYKFQKIIWL